MEYVSDRFTEQISSELITHEIDLFDRYALVKTTVKDYVRQSQFRAITDVIADQLKAIWIYSETIAKQIQAILQCLREQKNDDTSYGSGNLINLCHSLRLDLTDYDFSGLTIRHACLQLVKPHQAKLINARFIQCSFHQNFSSILAVAFSPDDSILATGDIQSQICLWHTQDGQSLMTLQGHLSPVHSVAWHPDGQRLASASDDQQIKVWDTKTGACLTTLEGHHGAV